MATEEAKRRKLGLVQGEPWEMVAQEESYKAHVRTAMRQKESGYMYIHYLPNFLFFCLHLSCIL